MAFGLGKDSPIILSQSRGNFEALIIRHGQWLRWRVAKKCPCITSHNRANVHCEKCGGSGDIYDYQREYDDIFRAIVRHNIIPVPDAYVDAKILEIYDARGKRFQHERHGNFLRITDAEIADNELVDVRIRVPLVKRIENVTLEKAGGGYYRVPGILTEPSKLQGVYHQAAGDVIAVDGLKNADGDGVEVFGFRRDMILADSDSNTLTARYVDYVMPFKFIVLSQELSKDDAAFVDTHNGGAVCTFPYMFNLSENDVLTVLSGSMTHKLVVEKRGDGIDDTIPEFFVEKVDGIETVTANYAEGEDFVLVGTNNIHWMGKQPEAGEKMAVTYRYHPTYRVAKEIPMLRTSENQRIPRKVALKLFAAYGESRRVNRND